MGSNTNIERRLHVIMPVGSDPMFKEKQHAIEKGAIRAGYVAQFPTYDPINPIFSIRDYLACVRDASAVLADLTGERPSCYYELGIAEALGVPTHLVASANTEIHQSSVRSRIEYYSNLHQLEELSAGLLIGT